MYKKKIQDKYKYLGIIIIDEITQTRMFVKKILTSYPASYSNRNVLDGTN